MLSFWWYVLCYFALGLVGVLGGFCVYWLVRVRGLVVGWLLLFVLLWGFNWWVVVLMVVLVFFVSVWLFVMICYIVVITGCWVGCWLVRLSLFVVFCWLLFCFVGGFGCLF